MYFVIRYQIDDAADSGGEGHRGGIAWGMMAGVCSCGKLCRPEECRSRLQL